MWTLLLRFQQLRNGVPSLNVAVPALKMIHVKDVQKVQQHQKSLNNMCVGYSCLSSYNTTWWWPIYRAETCSCIPNVLFYVKIYIYIVVFWPYRWYIFSDYIIRTTQRGRHTSKSSLYYYRYLVDQVPHPDKHKTTKYDSHELKWKCKKKHQHQW